MSTYGHADSTGRTLTVGDHVITHDGVFRLADGTISNDGAPGNPIAECLVTDFGHGVVAALHGDGTVTVAGWEATGDLGPVPAAWLALIDDPRPARTAGFEFRPDGTQFWRDPGNGQFARVGWSTKKGMLLDLVRGLLARDYIKDTPGREGFLAPDGDALSEFGVPRGSTVKVRYHDDDFGLVDLPSKRGDVYPTKIRWDRFSDDVPDAAETLAVTPRTPDLPAEETLARMPELTGDMPTTGLDLRTFDFASMPLDNIDFGTHNMAGVDLSGRTSKLSRFWSTNLERANLSDADFTDSDFRAAELFKANVSGSKFGGANLTDTSFAYSSARGAEFSGAKLVFTDFQHADLTGASFAGPLGGDLRTVDFRHANVSGVDFTGTQLTASKFDGVKYDDTTKFPDGFVPPASAIKLDSDQPAADVGPTVPDTAVDPAVRRGITGFDPAELFPTEATATPSLFNGGEPVESLLPPTMFDTTGLDTGPVAPQIPADYDAKLWEKRLTPDTPDTPDPLAGIAPAVSPSPGAVFYPGLPRAYSTGVFARQGEPELLVGPGSDPSYRVPWANHVPDGVAVVAFESGGTDTSQMGKAERAIRDAGFDPSLVTQRGLSEDRNDPSKAYVEIKAKPDAADIVAGREAPERLRASTAKPLPEPQEGSPFKTATPKASTSNVRKALEHAGFAPSKYNYATGEREVYVSPQERNAFTQDDTVWIFPWPEDIDRVAESLEAVGFDIDRSGTNNTGYTGNGHPYLIVKPRAADTPAAPDTPADTPAPVDAPAAAGKQIGRYDLTDLPTGSTFQPSDSGTVYEKVAPGLYRTVDADGTTRWQTRPENLSDDWSATADTPIPPTDPAKTPTVTFDARTKRFSVMPPEGGGVGYEVASPEEAAKRANQLGEDIAAGRVRVAHRGRDYVVNPDGSVVTADGKRVAETTSSTVRSIAGWEPPATPEAPEADASGRDALFAGDGFPDSVRPQWDEYADARDAEAAADLALTRARNRQTDADVELATVASDASSAPRGDDGYPDTPEVRSAMEAKLAADREVADLELEFGRAQRAQTDAYGRLVAAATADKAGTPADAAPTAENGARIFEDAEGRPLINPDTGGWLWPAEAASDTDPGVPATDFAVVNRSNGYEVVRRDDLNNGRGPDAPADDVVRADVPDPAPTITAAKSAAKVRPVKVGDREVAVRFVTGTSPSPFGDSPAKVIEADGENVGWIRSNGKAYADPTLPSNYDIVDAEGRATSYEGFSREEAVATFLGYRDSESYRRISPRTTPTTPTAPTVTADEMRPVKWLGDDYLVAPNGDVFTPDDLVFPVDEYQANQIKAVGVPDAPAEGQADGEFPRPGWSSAKELTQDKATATSEPATPPESDSVPEAPEAPSVPEPQTVTYLGRQFEVAADGKITENGTKIRLGDTTAAKIRELAANGGGGTGIAPTGDDLVPLIRNFDSRDAVETAGYSFDADPKVGDKAVVFSRGSFRSGIVVDVTPTRATVAYTTAGAVNTNDQTRMRAMNPRSYEPRTDNSNFDYYTRQLTDPTSSADEIANATEKLAGRTREQYVADKKAEYETQVADRKREVADNPWDALMVTTKTDKKSNIAVATDTPADTAPTPEAPATPESQALTPDNGDSGGGMVTPVKFKPLIAGGIEGRERDGFLTATGDEIVDADGVVLARVENAKITSSDTPVPTPFDTPDTPAAANEIVDVPLVMPADDGDPGPIEPTDLADAGTPPPFVPSDMEPDAPEPAPVPDSGSADVVPDPLPATAIADAPDGIPGETPDTTDDATPLEQVLESPAEPETPPSSGPLPSGKFPPTFEQLDALDKFATGDDLVVEAGAGAGKTASLVLLANQAKSQGRRGLFTAFNTGIVNDAKGRMPSNTPAKTMHSVAYGPMVAARPDIKVRMGKEYKNLTRHEIARKFDVPDATVQAVDPDSPPMRVNGLRAVSFLNLARDRFAQSDDAEPDWWHVPPLRGAVDPEANKAWRKSMVPALRRMWADIEDPKGKLRMKHGDYLKLFQMEGPNLGLDFIMMDEAQDTAPVMEAILLTQRSFGTQIVAVGDSAQAINGFTGARDSIGRLKAQDGVRTASLTQSFRFGPQVAALANNVLARFTDFRIAGSGGESSIGPIADPDAILTRTNGTAMTLAIGAIEEGKTVAMSKNLKKNLTEFSEAAIQLREQGYTSFNELSAFGSWDEVVRYATDDPAGEELRTLVKLVDDIGPDQILATLAKVQAVGSKNVDINILTAHTSKGLQFPKVRLADDFPPLFDPKTGEMKLTDEDFMLMYVALTRAQKQLDPGANTWIEDPPDGVDVSPAVVQQVPAGYEPSPVVKGWLDDYLNTPDAPESEPQEGRIAPPPGVLTTVSNVEPGRDTWVSKLTGGATVGKAGRNREFINDSIVPEQTDGGWDITPHFPADQDGLYQVQTEHAGPGGARQKRTAFVLVKDGQVSLADMRSAQRAQDEGKDWWDPANLTPLDPATVTPVADVPLTGATPDAGAVPDANMPPPRDFTGPFADYLTKYPGKLTDGDVENDPSLIPLAAEALRHINETNPAAIEDNNFLSSVYSKMRPGRDLSLKQARGVLNAIRRSLEDDAAGAAPGAAPDAADLPATAVGVPDVAPPRRDTDPWNAAQILAGVSRLEPSLDAQEILNGRPVVGTTYSDLQPDGSYIVTATPGIVDEAGVFHPAGPAATAQRVPRYGGGSEFAKWLGNQKKADDTEVFDLTGMKPVSERSVTELLGGSYTADDIERLLRRSGLTDQQRAELRQLLDDLQGPRQAATAPKEMTMGETPDEYPGGAYIVADRRPGTTTAEAHTAALESGDGTATLLIDDEPVAVWAPGVVPTPKEIAEVVTSQGWKVTRADDGAWFTLDPLPPRERCRAAGLGSTWLVAADNYLSRNGVRRGSAARVRYVDDEYGEIDVTQPSGQIASTKVRWDRFSAVPPTATTEMVDEPRNIGNITKAAVGVGSVTAERVRVAGTGHALVADGYLNRWGIERGSVVPVAYLDDSTAVISTPDGQTVRASWSRFSDEDPAAITLDDLAVVDGSEFAALPAGTRFAVEALGAPVQVAGRTASLVKNADNTYSVAGEPVVAYQWNDQVGPHLRLLVQQAQKAT